MRGTSKFASDVRERSVQTVRSAIAGPHDRTSRNAVIVAVSGEVGCAAETLRGWVKRAEWIEARRRRDRTEDPRRLEVDAATRRAIAETIDRHRRGSDASARPETDFRST